MGTSRGVGYNGFVLILGLVFGGRGDALADPPGAPASDSTVEAPKTLPQVSIFSSVHQSFKTNPELLVVRGHFDLGSPPDVLRYYCVINTKTGKREPLAVRADLAPHAGGMTGIKNVAVSLYACADAEQQRLLVTTGYSVGSADSGAPPPAPQAHKPTQGAASLPPSSPDKSQVSPNQIDVAGVKLGMSPDEVRAVLKSKTLRNYDESAETLSYLDPSKGVMQPIPNGRFVNVIAAWTAPSQSSTGDPFQVDGEAYEVMFTPVPGQERAMGIVHSVGYSPANAIREVALEGGLIKKYGGFSESNDLPESPTWRLQSGGTVQVGDSCNRRGLFGGLGGLTVVKTARENLALKRTPDDFKLQIERCGVAVITEDHFTANGGALHAERLVTRFTVSAYSPSIAYEGAKMAVQLVQAAAGAVKKADGAGAKDQPPSNL